MNKIAKEIRDYWSRQSQYFMWDSEVLDAIIPTLPQSDIDALTNDPDGKSEQYWIAVNRAFNRHNDVICGYTTIREDGALCSAKSAITELDVSYATIRECNKHGVYHIKDIEDDIPDGLSLDAAAELTAAIISYNEKHSE